MRKGLAIVISFIIIGPGAFAGWVKEDIDNGSSETSIVLDSSGYPHVAYGGVKYGYKDASGWHIETIDGGNDPALTLDAQGRPHISYKVGNELKYAYYNGSDWEFESVRSGGSHSSIRIDANGYPYIGHCFDDAYNLTVIYSYKNESGWHHNTHDYPVQCTSIYIDSDFDLHASYLEGMEVYYLTYGDYGWEWDFVDSL